MEENEINIHEKCGEYEISLVDIAFIILKHRKVLFITFTSVVIVAVVVALLMTRKHEYKTVIEIGSYYFPGGEWREDKRVSIEQIDQAKTKLEERFIVSTKNNYLKEGDNKQMSFGDLPKILVNAPEKSNVIVLLSKGREESELLMLDLHQRIADAMVEDHEEMVFDVIEQAIQKKSGYKLQIQQLDFKIAGLRKQQTKNNEKLKLLDQKEKLTTKQLERVSAEISDLVDQKKIYVGGNVKSRDAMAVLLIDNEIKQSRGSRERLEQELLINIKKERLELAVESNSIERAIATSAQEASRLLDIYQRYALVGVDGMSNEPLELQEITQDNSAAVKLTSQIIRPTKVVVEPFRSMPVGIGRFMVILMGIITALLLGFIGCFFAEFFEKIRKHYLTVA